MELRDYPRPPFDTGIGIHWSGGDPAAVGLPQIRDAWLPELQALGVSWVKLPTHRGVGALAELLLAAGIMPIVRLFRPQPNPNSLDAAALAQLENLLQIGVRYFEFNQEPDLPAEWQGGQLPADALAQVATNAIVDMEAILERGGLPGLPALAVGCRWDLVGAIITQGGQDLLAGPVWQAIHNYSLNHPLDYPYDLGHQEGMPYTQRFYSLLQAEEWAGDPWQGRTLAQVNQLRAQQSRPGATLMDDAAGWLAYEYWDALNRRHLGRSLPILSTENGYLVGEGADPRYPATTPNLHLAQTVEACRIMMGSSRRYAPAPLYYFCTAFWLLANQALGGPSLRWEPHAWYSAQWPTGALPVVQALRREPKQARRHSSVTADGPTAGATQAADPVPDQPRNSAAMGLVYAGTTVPGAVASAANQVGSPTRSAIGGVAYGYGATEIQLEDGAGMCRAGRLDEEGHFDFGGLGAGEYALVLAAVRYPGLQVDGEQRLALWLDRRAPEWVARIARLGLGPGLHSLRLLVADGEGWPVRVWRDGWQGITSRATAALPAGWWATEVAPLSPGRYQLELPNCDMRAQVSLAAGEALAVYFAPLGQLEPTAAAQVAPESPPAAPPPAAAETAEGEAPPERSTHYLFLGSEPFAAETLVQIMHYVARFQPTVGADLAAALQAEHVTILGGEEVVSQEQATQLAAAGCVVDRIEVDMAAELQRRVEHGSAW